MKLSPVAEHAAESPSVSQETTKFTIKSKSKSQTKLVLESFKMPKQGFEFIASSQTMTKRVVFVSRRNSLRSVLAQACLARIGAGRFLALSCGEPGQVSAEIHPAAMGALYSAGMPVPSLRPRGWDAVARGSAPGADFVITLDESVQQRQPNWPGQPYFALWSLPDAAALADAEQAAHLATQFLYALRRRLELLVSLPFRGADPAAIRSDIRDLGHLD